MNKIVLLLSLVAQSLLMSSSYGDIIFSFATGTPVGNSYPINLLAMTTGSDSLNSVDISTISLSAGTFIPTGPSGVSGTPTGSLVTGTLGSANVNSASVLAIDPSSISNNLAYLSIAYNAPQLYPSSNTLIASWNVNVTGVSPSFTISIDPLSIAAFSSSGQVAGSVLNNNFVVTVAVPEPSSALLVVLASAICFKRRRK